MIISATKRFFSKSTLLWVVFLSFFAGMVFCSVPSVMARAANGSSLAPVNPAFQKYMADKKAGKLPKLTSGGHAKGYIPPPIKLSVVSQSKPLAAAKLPVKYDLRTKNKLTPVRDQGDCGACWAFATFGSLESLLMPAQKTNFSEQDLNKNHGFDAAECDGGDHVMSTAYLARWSGPLKETDAPYPYAPTASAQKHVQDVTFFMPRANAKDNAAIKAAVMSSGAVAVSYYSDDDAYFNPEESAYYCDQVNDADHEVAVVGWDDGFDKSNFDPETPPGDGAFIVRNSWGSDWGDGGYFYLSYYDKNFSQDAAFANAEPTTNYSAVYQYDPLGLVTSLGFETPTAWGANIFKATSAAKLKAVSFYTMAPNSSYEIYVYTNVTAGKPRSGKLASTKKGKIAAAGYHTVVINEATLTAGKLFSVVMKFTTPGMVEPIPLEGILEDYSSAATANPGESFAGEDGKAWFDLVTDPDYADSQFNVCIKAFTKK